MSEPTSESSSRTSRPAPRVVRIGRLQIALNVILQSVAVIALLIMANFLAFRHHRSLDWSGTSAFSLSPQTTAVLKQFQEPGKAIVYFFDVGSPVYHDTVRLLQEYENQSNRKLVLEVVAAGMDPQRARELQAKYKFDSRENIVILDYKGKSKWVEASDFAEMEELPPEKQRPEEGVVARVKNFKAEQYITAAMMDLVEEKQNKVYLVTGHGELDLSKPDFQMARQAMEHQNLKLDNLSLTGVDKIPDDANTVVIAGPQQDFSERDLKLLSEYWGHNGRLFVALGPEAEATNLSAWLNARGVTLRNDRVIRVTGKLVENVVQKYEVRPAEGTFTAASRITQPLTGRNTGFIGETQSMIPVDSMFRAGEIAIVPLVLSAPEWWGEIDPITEGSLPTYADGKDHKGPLALAVAVEKGAVRDPKVQLETPRLVVVGNGLFLNDTGLKVLRDNRDFFVYSLNWLLNRESLLELPAKDRPLNDILLTNDQQVRLGFLLVLGIPICFGVLGLYYLGWRNGWNLLTITVVVVCLGLILWGAEETVRRWASGADSSAPATPAASPNSN